MAPASQGSRVVTGMGAGPERERENTAQTLVPLEQTNRRLERRNNYQNNGNNQ